MEKKKKKKKVQYPENVKLGISIKKAGFTIAGVARRLGISRVYLSNMVNGHEKGGEQIEKLTEILNQVQ